MPKNTQTFSITDMWKLKTGLVIEILIRYSRLFSSELKYIVQNISKHVILYNIKMSRTELLFKSTLLN